MATNSTLKVAITTPTSWPYVRRGGERFVQEIAAFLAERGHCVTILTGKPGRTKVITHGNVKTVYYRRLWHPSFARLGLLEFHAFFFRCLPALVRRRYDVVFATTFLDAFAAVVARRITSTPCVFWVNSLPPPVQYFRSLTLGGAVIRQALESADEVLSLSGYMKSRLEARFGRGGRPIPVPVAVDRFPLSQERDHLRPIVLCTAALEDRRKGGRLLLKAFGALKLRSPGARLHIAAGLSERTRRELVELVEPRWRPDVHFLGVGRVEDLPATYGRAAISVLPSLWEAFGLVVVESLATGTPVVATRHGALPELIDDSVGRLFDPGEVKGAEPQNVEGLVEAMIATLELSQQPETAERCRARAERFAWSSLGPRYEELLYQVARPREVPSELENPPPTSGETS